MAARWHRRLLDRRFLQQAVLCMRWCRWCCREVADNSKAQAQSDGTSLADKPEIILERLGFARPRQQQLVSAPPLPLQASHVFNKLTRALICTTLHLPAVSLADLTSVCSHQLVEICSFDDSSVYPWLLPHQRHLSVLFESADCARMRL